jgi:hypothetical protein
MTEALELCSLWTSAVWVGSGRVVCYFCFAYRAPLTLPDYDLTLSAKLKFNEHGIYQKYSSCLHLFILGFLSFVHLHLLRKRVPGRFFLHFTNKQYL